MDFSPSDRVVELLERVREFMAEHVDPVEREALEALDEEVAPGVPYPRILVELRERARAEGLWNLFLPDERWGPGLTNWEYGMLCEQMGRNPVAPLVFNCSAPDTGNMEIVAEHGTPEQHERFLQPLLDGDVRSCFSMTEPETAGSDPPASPPAPSSTAASGSSTATSGSPPATTAPPSRSRWSSPIPTRRRTSARA